MTPRQTNALKKLALRPTSAVELSDEEIRTVQDLVSRGLARDFSDQYGHRIPIHYRIWGITIAGKATLEQQSITQTSTKRQLGLTLTPQSKLKMTRTRIPPSAKKDKGD